MADKTNTNDAEEPDDGQTRRSSHCYGCGEAETRMYATELRLLRKVAEKSSDLVKGRHWGEFREAVGGVEVLEKEHTEAVNQLEKWYDECSDCREFR